MSAQLPLLARDATIATPAFMCPYEPRCSGKRATAGPWTGDEECRNQTITCQCGRTGTVSENLRGKKGNGERQ